MSIRRSLIGLVAAAAVALSACSSATSSGVPSVAIPSVALPSLAVPSASGLQGFCADFAAKVAAKWPNIDASTATAVAPLFTQWASEGGDGRREGRCGDDRCLADRDGGRRDGRVTATGRRDRLRSPQGLRGLELLGETGASSVEAYDAGRCTPRRWVAPDGRS